MNHIFYAIFVYVLTVFFHIILVRIARLTKLISIKQTLFVYPLGLFVLFTLLFVIFPKQSNNLLNNPLFSIPLPYSAFIITSCLMIVTFLWTLTPVLQEEGPTSLIQTILRRNGRLTFEEIMRKISDLELFDRRIESLVESKVVDNNHLTYTITQKGKLLTAFINWYFKLIKWEQSA